ncbi:hypothetical protein, partial [Ferrovum sp.]|uniref:hypothetical protein n=1 Tax=Ferrovum sp. TaxID=2609467 RepID=UPI00260C02D1
FQLLDEHGAIIGRNSARIVVDLSKAPTIMQDEIGEIFRTSQLVAPNCQWPSKLTHLWPIKMTHPLVGA